MRHDTEMPRETPVQEHPSGLADGPWRWRNLRSVGLGVQVWSWPWMVDANFDADAYGGTADISFGPFLLTFYFNCGSAENIRRIDRDLAGPQTNGGNQ